MRLVVVGGVEQGDDDDIGLPIMGAREGSIGRAQPHAVLIKGLAGGKVLCLKCARPPDWLVSEPTTMAQESVSNGALQNGSLGTPGTRVAADGDALLMPLNGPDI